MKLASWLEEKNINRRDFAGRIGVSEVAVTRYLNGDRIPRRAHMLRIAEVTSGEVTANDFMFLTQHLSSGDAA